VHANASIDGVKGIGQRDRIGIARHIAGASNGDDLLDARSARAFDHCFGFASVFLALDMSVAVDQHDDDVNYFLISGSIRGTTTLGASPSTPSSPVPGMIIRENKAIGGLTL